MGGAGGRRRKARVRNELLSAARLTDDEFVRALREVSGVSKTTATAIAASFPQGDGLEHTSTAVLEELGATPRQAAKIKNIFGFVRMCDAACQKRAGTMRTPNEAAQEIVAAVSREIGAKDQEFFVVVLLDARQQIIDIFGTAVGSLSQVDVHPRELFKHALQARAHSVIIAHNHPSNDPSPSDADIELTRRMVQAGQLMGIPVLDSLVVTPGGDHASLASVGLMPRP